MAPKMPTLGYEPKKSPMPKVIVTALVIGLGAGGAFWWKNHRAPPADAGADATAPKKTLFGKMMQKMTGADASVSPEEVAQAAAPVAPTPPPPPTPQDRLKQSGLKAITTTINGPLESAIVEKAGPEVGPALTQVVTRTLVWWVRVPDEILRGDRLSVLYEERENEEPVVHAVIFESQKTGKTHKAFLYKAPHDTWARFFEPDGSELEERLQSAPLDDYEQVTSRLRDGRHHQGVDFKTPEGTPVRATFDGVVRRKNWHTRANGNSLEIAGASGRSAIFLHLSEIADSIRPGVHVHKGEVLGKSGNTGHSFAPHLHYQLMSGAHRAVDPFVKEAVVRRALAESDREGFETEMRKLESLLSSVVAGK